MNTLIFITGIVGIVVYDLLKKLRHSVEKSNETEYYNYLYSRLKEINDLLKEEKERTDKLVDELNKTYNK